MVSDWQYFIGLFNPNRRTRIKSIKNHWKHCNEMRNIYRDMWIEDSLVDKEIDFETHNAEMFRKYNQLCVDCGWFEYESNEYQIEFINDLNRKEL